MTVSKMAPAQMAPTDAVVEASFTKFSQVQPHFALFCFGRTEQIWYVASNLFVAGPCFWDWFWWLHGSHHLLGTNWCFHPFPQPPIGRPRQQIQALNVISPPYFVMITDRPIVRLNSCCYYWSNIDNHILEKNTNYLWWNNYWWLNQLFLFCNKKKT